MKKFTIISFALFYSFFNIGIIVNYHFCCDAFQGLTLIVSPGNCCEDDCPGCHNSSYEFKISDDYDNQISPTVTISQILSVIQYQFGIVMPPSFYERQDPVALGTGPLIHSARYPIYLSIRAFRI